MYLLGLIKNKKASVFLTVFFIVLVLGLFYLIALEAQDKNKEFRVEQLQRSYLGSYGELVKTFTSHAFRESTIRGAFLSALNCGGSSGCYWIYYAAPSQEIDLNHIKSDVEKRSELECNSFLESIEGLNFGKVVINESGRIEKVQVWVEPDDLTPKNNTASVDEYFNASSLGSKQAFIISALSPEQRFVVHAYTMTIYPLRYWYLYRVIKKWVDDGVLVKMTCQAEELIQGQAGSSCKGPAVGDITVDGILKAAVEELENRFKKKDEFVTCNYTIPCRYALTKYLCCCQKCSCPPPRCPKEECKIGSDKCKEWEKYCYKWKRTCDAMCTYLLPPEECHDICPAFGGGQACLATEKYSCKTGECDLNNLKFVGENKELGLNQLSLVPEKKEEHKTPQNPQTISPNSPVSPNSVECDEATPTCVKTTVKYDPLFHLESYTKKERCDKICLAKTGNPCHGFGENHTIEFVSEIVCTDKKYNLPVGQFGFENLKFRIKVHVYLNHWVEPPPKPRCKKVPCCYG